MKVYLLKIKKGFGKKGYDGLYVKGSTSYPVKQFTDDINKARLFRSKTSALMSANNGFSLKKQNGQQCYDVIEKEYK